MNVSRITPGTMIVAIFAVMFGLVGAYAVKRSLQEKPKEIEPGPPPVRMVRLPRASTDIKPDKPLTIGDIAIHPTDPKELDEMIRKGKIPGEPIVDTRQLIGRILREEVKSGSV